MLAIGQDDGFNSEEEMGLTHLWLLQQQKRAFAVLFALQALIEKLGAKNSAHN